MAYDGPHLMVHLATKAQEEPAQKEPEHLSGHRFEV